MKIFMIEDDYTERKMVGNESRYSDIFMVMNMKIFVLWIVVSNTLNIRMRLKMYNDVLGELRGQVTTGVKAEKGGVINMAHCATSNTMSHSRNRKDKVFKKRHTKLVKVSIGCRVNRNRKYKIMCKTDSVGKGNEREGECNNRVIHKKKSCEKTEGGSYEENYFYEGQSESIFLHILAIYTNMVSYK